MLSDEEFREKYDQTAEHYETGLTWLFRSFGEDEGRVRAQLVDLLELHPGARVLEVGCGTGRDTALIASRIGASGSLYASDLSVGMLRILSTRSGALAAKNVELFLCNAAYLPFADRAFDAVFHFGGINQFGDVPRALAEMTRVTRVGGKVVVGDEGVPPWLRDRSYGRVLINANPLYRHEPPLAHLPANASGVTVRWLLGQAFYAVDYRVAEGPPRVDLDLPIPGKGDSLRSRYAAKHPGETLD